MRRPLLMRLAPERVRMWLCFRRYYPAPPEWKGLFENARLSYAPSVTMDLIWPDVGHSQIAFCGFVEPGLSRRVVQLGRRGGLMLDVGANVGYFSLIWAASNPSNRCISFEASPTTSKVLQRNVEKNGFSDRIDVRDVAVSNENGVVRFDTGPVEQPGWGGISDKPDAISVPCVRLDSVIDGSEPIAMLKIDVEGADTWVIQGAESLLRRKVIREIQFENNRDCARRLGIGDDEANEFLKSCGYEVWGSLEKGWVARPKAS